MVSLDDVAADPASDPRRGKRVLVACHEFMIAGGLRRFERFGRVVAELGHEMAFLALGGARPPVGATEFPVLTFDEAARSGWDATFVPGAGHPDETIDRFAQLKRPSFGVRVQHVLNDTARKPGFLRVNRTFEPHVVVFNNHHWQPGDFTDFSGEAFHFLEGGVDLVQFAPDPTRRARRSGDPFIVGGLAAKNVEPLIDAIRLCDADVHLHLFGPSGELARRAADLIADGRLVLRGFLGERDLRAFYAEVDCVAHTELYAGWANLVAEAMACGVPVVCTPHGTRAFAEHEQTAIVVGEPTPKALATAIERLRGDPRLVTSLTAAARRRISAYPWASYSKALLRLAERPAFRYYTLAPDYGLFGKWPMGQRLDGLQPILESCASKSICDLGAGEGVVSRWLLDAGASLAHGFELDPTRVILANQLCQTFSQSRFWAANLCEWSSFEQEHRDHLLDRYDIVLYLGLHHHLPAATRMLALSGAAARATTWLAVRTPDAFYRHDGVEAALHDLGFTLVSSSPHDKASALGGCFIFKRH